ncbi:MAG: hypothetical protein LW823_04390 [Rickettsiales bacterium]|jgi:hypothetical protein|nr:hypothetical protein [Rickettsiales bacterium]
MMLRIKKTQNNLGWQILAVLFLFLVLMWPASSSMASSAGATPGGGFSSGGGVPVDPVDPPEFTIDECNNQVNPSVTFKPWHFTTKIVACLKSAVVTAVVNPNNPTQGFLPAMSTYMTPLVAVMIVFAVMVFGIRIFGGEPDLKPKAIGFLIRLGLVWFFAYNLGGFALKMFAVMDELVCLVTIPSWSAPPAVISQQVQLEGIWPEANRTIKYMSGGVFQTCYPWVFIDRFLGRLMGFGENLVLASGLMGLVSAATFSSTIGILIFLAGVMAFLDIIFVILRVVFMYLTSVLVLAFMIIISPLIIPMALFYTRENYFTSWLRIVMVAMLLPMMVFAFVGMFIGIFDLLIDRIFIILGGLDPTGQPQFDAYWRINEPKFSWLLPSDPNLAQDFEDITKTDIVGSPSVQTFINPYARRAMDATSFIVAPGVNFGPSGTKVEQQLVLGFVSLWIFSALLKSMLNLIPGVVQGIAKASINIGAPAATLESGMRKAITSLGKPS